MSLITRCPACGTMFKVVTDQLKVSRGWVRCGHCSEIFDASLHLQAAAPALVSQKQVFEEKEWSPGASFADRPYSPPVLSAGALTSVEDTQQGDFDPVGWRQQLHSPPIDESGVLRLDGQGGVIRTPQVAAPSISNSSEPDEAPDSLDSVSDDSVSAWTDDAPNNVSFVREARRKAFWRKPFVRFALCLASILLVALLAMQVLLQQRDTLAVVEPGLLPLLQMACENLQCEIQPPRHIEAIVIESSSFSKLTQDAYRLGFTIKNTGATPAALPSLEVTLTDTQDQPILRRVLTPEQFGATSQMLGAGSDVAGLVAVQLLATEASGGAARVAGYRVLAFYP